MRVILGALGFTAAGAIVGAVIGWAGNPSPVPLPAEGMDYVNYVGPILGGSIGATFGLIFGGGWFAARIANTERGGAV